MKEPSQDQRFTKSRSMDKELLSRLDINRVTKEIRKDSLSVKNRLQSILYDSKYIASLELEDVPLIPNERCGLWYVRPAARAGSSYFKSTDGHTNNWNFSFRRLNLHLLTILSQSPTKKIAIIDSTRKGKLMPDALLKTIPIWCAVLTCLLYEGISENEVADDLDMDRQEIADLMKNNWLRTPEEMVSRNEHNEIVKRIPGFLKELKSLKLVTQEQLINKLGSQKPIIPSWKYPKDTKEPFYFGQSANGHFIIECITASKKTGNSGSNVMVRRNDKVTSWFYVQGAADDHELWVPKDMTHLDANGFWEMLTDEIIDKDTGYIYDWMNDQEVISRMKTIETATIEEDLDVHLVKNEYNNTGIYFGKIAKNISVETLQPYKVSQLVIMSEHYQMNGESSRIKYQYFKIESSKKGSKKLRDVIPKVLSNLDLDQPVMILCDSGKDICVGLLLVILSINYNTNWTTPKSESNHINKDAIKQHLVQINEIHQVNPSRNTLQSVNSFVM